MQRRLTVIVRKFFVLFIAAVATPYVAARAARPSRSSIPGRGNWEYFSSGCGGDILELWLINTTTGNDEDLFETTETSLTTSNVGAAIDPNTLHEFETAAVTARVTPETIDLLGDSFDYGSGGENLKIPSSLWFRDGYGGVAASRARATGARRCGESSGVDCCLIDYVTNDDE